MLCALNARREANRASRLGRNGLRVEYNGVAVESHGARLSLQDKGSGGLHDLLAPPYDEVSQVQCFILSLRLAPSGFCHVSRYTRV